MLQLIGSIAKWGIISAVLVGLFVFVPFSIGIPTEIYNFLTSGSIKQVFNLIYYFFPVDFAVTCLLILILARHGGILWGLLSWIFHKISSVLS